MIVVVADTSPLNYLLLIEQARLLPILFEKVLLPEAAFVELQHPRTPVKVREWIAQIPSWLEVRSLSSAPNASLAYLDPGEREAIQIALDLRLQTVLMDDAEGRRAAESLRLEVCGTLGVLERAARLGEIDLRESLRRLEQTSFRISRAVREALLARNP